MKRPPRRHDGPPPPSRSPRRTTGSHHEESRVEEERTAAPRPRAAKGDPAPPTSPATAPGSKAPRNAPPRSSAEPAGGIAPPVPTPDLGPTPLPVRLVVEPDERGLRLDRLLQARLTGWTQGQLRKLVRGGRVTANGLVPRPMWYAKPGQIVEVSPFDEAEHVAQTLAPPEVVVRHDDPWLTVVVKPAGLVVHPAPGYPGQSIEERLAATRDPALPPLRAAHRLDRETSGLLVLAPEGPALRAIRQAFDRRHVTKAYRALVWGTPPTPSGVIDVPIETVAKRDGRRGRLAPGEQPGVDGVRESVTHYETVSSGPGWTELRITIETGRTHQIRLHLHHLGMAIIGDTVYGRVAQDQAQRRYPALTALLRAGGHFALHAATLQLKHPHSGAMVSFEEPPDAWYTQVSQVLKRKGGKPIGEE